MASFDPRIDFRWATAYLAQEKLSEFPECQGNNAASRIRDQPVITGVEELMARAEV